VLSMKEKEQIYGSLKKLGLHAAQKLDKQERDRDRAKEARPE